MGGELFATLFSVHRGPGRAKPAESLAPTPFQGVPAAWHLRTVVLVMNGQPVGTQAFTPIASDGWQVLDRGQASQVRLWFVPKLRATQQVAVESSLGKTFGQALIVQPVLMSSTERMAGGYDAR
jgi:hypothetical protein